MCALDPRIILGAVSPPGASKPFDPITTMGNIAQTQGLVQQQQIGQLQLADAQRAEQERGTLARAFQDPRVRVTDPVTGATTIDVPKALGLALDTSRNPLAIVKVQTEYGKSQAEAARADWENRKTRLEAKEKGFEVAGRVARGIQARIAAGQDPQAAWQWGLKTFAEAGMPTQGIPPTYDAGAMAGFAAMEKSKKEELDAERIALDRDRLKLEERQTVVQEEQVPLTRAKTARERKELEALERVQALEPGAAAGTKTMSEADVQDAMRQTGQPREAVIRAAHARGIRTPGKMAGEPTTAAAAPPTPAAAPTTPTAAPTTAPAAPTTAPAAPAPRAPAPGTLVAPLTAPAPAAPAIAPAPAAVVSPPPAPVAGQGPVAPAPVAAPTTATPAATSPRLQADEQRLRRLEELRKNQEEHIEVLRPYSTSEAGSRRLQQAERELERRNTEIDRLRTRLFEQGPEKQQRALQLEEAKPLAEERGKRQVRENQSLQEVLKDDATHFWDTSRAQQLTGAENYLETEQRQRAGEVKRLTANQQKRMEALDTALPSIARAQWYFDQIWGENGVFTQLSDTERGQLATAAGWAQLRQRNPVLVQAERFFDNLAPQLARTLGGEVGALSNQDVERIRGLLPRFGVGVDLWNMRLSAPDTYRTALGAMDDLTELYESSIGSTLGKRDFRHPALRRYVRPEEWITPQQRTEPGRGYAPQGELPQRPGTPPPRQGFGQGLMPR